MRTQLLPLLQTRLRRHLLHVLCYACRTAALLPAGVNDTVLRRVRHECPRLRDVDASHCRDVTLVGVRELGSLPLTRLALSGLMPFVTESVRFAVQ